MKKLRLLISVFFLCSVGSCSYAKDLKKNVRLAPRGPIIIDTEVAQQHAELMLNPSERYLSGMAPSLPDDPAFKGCKVLPPVPLGGIFNGSPYRKGYQWGRSPAFKNLW